MTKLTLAALALALSVPSGTASAASFASFAAALTPHSVARTGRRPRSARMEHCSRKADAVRVQGKARAIYLRKCAGA